MKQSQKNPIIDVKQKSYQSSTLQTSTTIVPKPVLKTQKPKETKRILRGQDATPNNDHKKTFTFRPGDTSNKRRQCPKNTVHKPERVKVKIKRWKKVEKQPLTGILERSWDRVKVYGRGVSWWLAEIRGGLVVIESRTRPPNAGPPPRGRKIHPFFSRSILGRPPPSFSSSAFHPPWPHRLAFSFSHPRHTEDPLRALPSLLCRFLPRWRHSSRHPFVHHPFFFLFHPFATTRAA